MPLPSPNKKESKDSWISRCMANKNMNKEFPDSKQRSAVCYRKWDDSQKGVAAMSLHKLPHIAARIFNTPLLVTYDRITEIIVALNDRIEINVSSDGVYADNHIEDYSPERIDNVAVIPVHGTLVHQGGFADALSGIQSYSEIRSMYHAALESTQYDSILWSFKSPGGEVSGLFDFIDEIYESRGIKPMAAIVNEMAMSAAFGLASAVGDIYIPRTGMVGSVGVIAMHRDQSKADEKAGLKYTAVYAGAKKNEGNPHEPFSKADREALQERVNDTYELFTKTVARNLGVPQQAIKDTEAGDYIGEKAVQIGFATQIASYREVINHLQYLGGNNMPITNPQGNAEAQRIVMLETEIGKLKAQIDENEATITAFNAKEKEIPTQLQSEVEKERARISQIISTCALHNVPELAEGFIKDGKTIDDVNAAILSALAEKSNIQNTLNTKIPDPKDAPNPLIELAKKRAEAAKASWQKPTI
jgi:ClpP class serine protease